MAEIALNRATPNDVGERARPNLDDAVLACPELLLVNRKMLFFYLPNRRKATALGRLASSSGLSLAALSLGLVANASAQSSSTPTPVPMPVPSVVGPATLVSHMQPSTMLNMSISLAPANRAAFQAFADAVSNPLSPDFHRFIQPADIGARFGASQTTIDAVTAYLKSKGLTVTMVSDSRLSILFKGKVSAVETAFSTKLNQYHAASRPTPGPADFYSYATTPKVPASFASTVVSIGGLQTAYSRAPLTTYLTPAQSRGLYQASSLYANGHKGLGVTVGITNLGDGYRLSNLPLFYSTFGLPTPTGGVGSNVSAVSVAGTDGNTQPEGIETNLDIQMVLAEAPFANVVVYDGWTDLVSIASREVQDNLIDIASESWVFSDSADVLQAMNDEHVAMTMLGITYMAGTGDWGADESRGNYPHAYPDVIAIGGTDATVSDAFGTRQNEMGWYYSGAGWEPTDVGYNHTPPYQKGTSLPTGLNRRLFPDWSLQAAGSLLVYSGSVGAVGGTSSSGPQFAGILALILETLKSENAVDLVGTHYRLGRIQDTFYPVGSNTSVFWDVTVGAAENLLPDGTTAQSKVGWDYVTGWGAPIAQGMHDTLLSAGSVNLLDSPSIASIYTVAHPTVALGTQPLGSAADLTSMDGVSYSVQSVQQSGVGQVAAATIGITLQTAKTRRSAVLNVGMGSPALTTDYIYLLNKNTNVYDLISTVTGTGAMKSTAIQLDVSSNGKYIKSDGTVSVLVRAMKPSRLGNAAFRLMVDQASVTEKVSRGG